MHFLPHFPIHWNASALFGLTLLLGLLGGEIAYRTNFLPRLSGYLLVGFLVGAGGFDIVTPDVLVKANLFVKISLSLILFDLGRHLDFNWLKNDKSLLLMALAESCFTFIAVYLLLYLVTPLSTVYITIAAILAIATSPAVLMMVAQDVSAEGPVSRRAFMLTSINNLIALILFNFFVPDISDPHASLSQCIECGMYRFFGALTLGAVIFYVTKSLAFFLGKRIENQFVLLTGSVVLTIGLATALNLPATLSLFILGVAARNLDGNHSLMEIDFSWFARILFVLLFVVTGAKLQIHGLYVASLAVILFIFTRALSKWLGIVLFYRYSRITWRQCNALTLTLMPMSSVAIGMFSLITSDNALNNDYFVLFLAAVVTILNVIGPVLTQFAFHITGEDINSVAAKES